MKLHGLVVSGVLLLVLGGIGGWWILGRHFYFGSVSSVVTIQDELKSAQSENPGMWLVWYGDDAAVYRLRVSVVAYEDLYASLRQALAQDQLRLETISETDLSAMLTPIFAKLPPRLNPFLDDLFNVTGGASLLWHALSIADDAVSTDASAPPTTAQIGVITRTHLANVVLTKFRDTVLMPSFTLRALRSASGRAFLMVHQDILENCNRYDRAFRSFVLKAPGTVESRDGNTWRADPYWQQGNATFLSLCAELRRLNAGQLSDAPLIEAFTTAEETVLAQSTELVRQLVDVSVDLAMRKRYNVDTLKSFGLPTGIAQVLATGKSSFASAVALAKITVNQLGGIQGKERFKAGLRITLDGLQTDSVQRLHSVYRTFIAAEIERIGLNLASRSEGVWSRQ